MDLSEYLFDKAMWLSIILNRFLQNQSSMQNEANVEHDEYFRAVFESFDENQDNCINKDVRQGLLIRS